MKNTVCSPINLYIAFAMLAETSMEIRGKQILDMLGAQDMDTLRKMFLHSGKATCDTPALEKCAGKFMWLDVRRET